MKKALIIGLKIGLGVIVLLMTLGNNCITSGNVVIVIDNIADVTAQTEDNFGGSMVDLRNNSSWQDHKDQLNSVDDIGFACKITNHEPTAATGQIWISEKLYADADSMSAASVKILDGIVIPAATDTAGVTRSIEWKDSYDYLEHFNEAKKIIYDHRDNEFYIYFRVAETPFKIDVKNIVLFLSVNGKP